MQNLNRSFPEAREFLLKEIVGPDYPAKHLIEQARNKGHITKGKQGRGGGVVTSRDMAILLIGTLAGDTPHAASDAMAHLSQLKPHAKHLVPDELKDFPLVGNWWELSFIDAITQFIDVARKDFHFDFDEICVHIAQFIAVKAGRWFTNAAKIKQTNRFIARNDIHIAMAPAKPEQIAEHGIG